MDFNKVINSPRIGEYKSSCVPKVERNDLFTAKLLWKRHSIKIQNAKTLHQNSFLSYRQIVKTFCFWWPEEDIIKIKNNKFRGFWISDRDLTMRACQIINIGNTKMIEGLWSNGNFLVPRLFCDRRNSDRRLSDHDICPTYAFVRPVICPTKT